MQLKLEHFNIKIGQHKVILEIESVSEGMRVLLLLWIQQTIWYLQAR